MGSLIGLVALSVIAIVAGVVWTRNRSRQAARNDREPAESEFQRLLRKGDAGTNQATPSSVAKPARRRSGRMSASDLLATVRTLRSRTAQWSEIIPAINPSSDANINYLLTNLRGPHQFAPQVALNSLEDGCERVLARDPRADASDALKETLRRADIATNVRD